MLRLLFILQCESVKGKKTQKHTIGKKQERKKEADEENYLVCFICSKLVTISLLAKSETIYLPL